MWLKTPFLLRSTTICQFIVCHKALQINLKLKGLKDERNSSRFLWGWRVYGEVSMHVRSPCVSYKSLYLHCDVDCEFPKIMYHSTVVDTHCANRIMNIPLSNTFTWAEELHFFQHTLLPQKGNRDSCDFIILYVFVWVPYLNFYLIIWPIFLKRIMNVK